MATIPLKSWGIDTYRESPEAGGHLVIEILIAGYAFPIRVLGTGRR